MIRTSRRIAAAVLLTTLIGAGSLWAGPPFITDDPDPVSYQHWEVYLFSIYSHSQGGNTGLIPAVEVNYGVVPDVQLHVIAPVAYDHASGVDAHYGYGDTELGVKYRFIPETDYCPEVGIFPLVEVPTGQSSRGLGNGHTQVFAPLLLQKSFGEDKEWTTYAGGGFWYNPGDDHRNFFRYGWELQRNLSEQFTLGGEIYHETPMASGDHGHTAFNLGGYVNFGEHHHLLFSAGRDIHGPNYFSTYLGYQLTF